MPKLTKASFGTTPDSFKHVVDNVLVADAAQPVRRKGYMTVIIAAVLILALACTAVAAITLRRSPQQTAIKQAQQAIAAAYGLTPESLDFFGEAVEENEKGWLITFTPHLYHEQMGTYRVALTRAGEAFTYWTHDGADLTALRQAGMDSPIWGQVQVETMLQTQQAYTARLAEMEKQLGPLESWTLAQKAELDAPLVGLSYIQWKSELNVLPGEGGLLPEEAVEKARQAIEAEYGLTQAQLDEYATDISLVTGAGSVEPMPVYYVILYDADAASPREGLGTLRVALYASSGEVALCTWLVDNPALAQQETLAADPEAEKAIALAKTALNDRYALTDEMLAFFTFTATHEEDSATWTIQVEPQDTPDWDFIFTDLMGTYTVTVSDATDGVTRCEWSHINTEIPDDYTAESLGRAPAWNADMLRLFIPFETQRTAMLAERRAAGLPVNIGLARTEDELRAEAAYQQFMRDAGFSRRLFDMGFPQAGEVTWSEAMLAARQVLKEDYALTDGQLDGLDFMAFYTVADPDLPKWHVAMYPKVSPESEAYMVTINGLSGEVEESTHEIVQF